MFTSENKIFKGEWKSMKDYNLVYINNNLIFVSVITIKSTVMKELIKFLDKYNISYTVEGDYVIADNIYLSNKSIESLPESFGYIKCNNLYLDNNELTTLPESFGNLKCDELYLSNNKLTSLPESIGNIKCDELYLYENKLTTLPESFGNLKCNNLSLFNNKLTSLPESIGNLKCNNINLSNNNLTSLPESIGNIKCNYINLYNNQLTSLPESFGNLKCNYLYLSNNKLTELPKHKKFDEIDIGNDYIYCDYILTHYESIKFIGEYKVYVGYNDNFVVTKDDKVFAHGMSIRQGISDLLFKLSNRNLSDYKDLDINSELDLDEAIIMYRIITGACSYGVEEFMKGKEFNDKISIKEINGLIGDEYGSKVFRKFFEL